MSSPNHLVVGVDLGTSGVRAIAFDRRLRAVAQASRSYPVSYAEGGVAEQSATEVAEASEACIQEVAQREDVVGRVRALAFCGTASSLALFQAERQEARSKQRAVYGPASPAWLWADIRAAQEAQLVSLQFGADACQRTGCPVHASYWPAKLLYWRRHGFPPFGDNGAPSAMYRLAGRKDYLLYRLTGEWVIDRSTAAATGLFDSEHGVWDQELTEWLNVAPNWLPRVVPITERLALQPEAAERLQLPADTEIVVGALDGVLVHLGMGCAQEGLASCTIGTSSAARMSSPRRITDEKGRTWCYPVVDDLWLAGGAGNNGGNVLTWFTDLCNDMARLVLFQKADGRVEEVPDATADRVIELAMQVPPGADGLLLMPYLFGERSPLWREDLRGAFVGLSSTHTLSHMARSVLEGISLAINGIYRALVEQIGTPREVRAGGGFVASPQWVQLQADVFGVPVAVTGSGQETATGAAMVGWHAVEDIPLQELQDRIEVTGRLEPRPEVHERYRELFARLEETRHRLAEPARQQAE